MPMLPSDEHMDIIDRVCMLAVEKGEPRSAFDIAGAIMDEPELPMHCPYHHYLTAASLLTAAVISTGGDAQKLKKLLKTARERAGMVPGGYCGQFGCCGAAVSAGIFAAVWQKTTPLSKTGWAESNDITARALAAIASAGGPRCCKRVTYLALTEAVRASREMLGVDVGEVPEIVCHHFENNSECLHSACPFFPEKNAEE